MGLFVPQVLASQYSGEVYNISDDSEQKVPDVKTGTFCSCVVYVRSQGVDIPTLGEEGTPDSLIPNSPPVQGAAVLFSYGHIAYIQAILPGGMWVTEANKTPCEKTERFVPYDDPFIRGFYI